MTAAAMHADVAAPVRRGWRAFLWVSALTTAWAVLTYWQPAIQASGVPLTAMRLFIYAVIALGLWLGLERAEFSSTQRRNVWLAVIIPYTLWMAVMWSAAINGVFRPGASPIPVPLVPLAIVVPVLVGLPILLRSRRIGEVLDGMPPTWLVGLQVFRVFGSIFLVNWMLNLAPGVFALPAGMGDVITGLFALPVAILLASGGADGRRAAIAWNIFGLLDFTVAVTIGLLTSPGPLQLVVPSIPNPATALYPTVLIPAFTVPSSILLHALSLRQLYRRGRRAETVAAVPARALA
jgi:hypothetical protein